MVLASGKSKQLKINSYRIQKILFITHSGSLFGTFLPQLLQGVVSWVVCECCVSGVCLSVVGGCQKLRCQIELKKVKQNE